DDNPHRLRHYFNRAADAQWIKKSITHRGRPYVADHLPNLRFDDARHAGVTEKTAQRIEKIYHDRFPDRAPPVIRRFGLHLPGAPHWMSRTLPAAQIIFRNKDNGKKP